MTVVIRFIARVIEVVTILLFVVLLLDVLWGVFSRYILGGQTRWTEELAGMLLVWVSLLGAALVFRDKGHLGVDYFVSKFDPEVQNLIEIFIHIVVILFAVLIMIIGGYQLVSRTLESNQVKPALGLKVGYFYLAVPISGLLIVLFTLELMFKVFKGKGSVSSGSVVPDEKYAEAERF